MFGRQPAPATPFLEADNKQERASTMWFHSLSFQLHSNRDFSKLYDQPFETCFFLKALRPQLQGSQASFLKPSLITFLRPAEVGDHENPMAVATLPIKSMGIYWEEIGKSMEDQRCVLFGRSSQDPG